MHKLRVIIADDERPAREFLKAILAEFEQVVLVGDAENGPDAVELIEVLKPDLAILDLKMPEMTGLDVVKALSETQMPLVAFVTAHDEFAVEAFELNAVDYLLKPVEKARLSETIERAFERLEHADWRSREVERVRNAVSDYSRQDNENELTHVPVKVREEILLIPVEEIASIVASGELLQITTVKNQRFVINHRLKDLEARLDQRKFVRLSRGAIVNLSCVSRIAPMPGGTYNITLVNRQEINSSRLQSKILRSRLLKL